MSPILVTGAAGFIGRSLCSQMAASGFHVITDRSVGAVGRIPISVASLERACAGVKPGLIVHAAGSGAVGQVEQSPAEHLPPNLQAILAVLEFARQCAPNARVAFLSSAAVYGAAPAIAQREPDMREAVSLYGLSKQQAEQLMAHYSARYSVACTAVRLFSVYGPGLRKQLLWDAMGKFASGRQDFFGTGQEVRDWVHIEDVGQFIFALARRPGGAVFEVFNCGGEAASTSEVLTHLATVAGAAAPQFNGQARPGDPLCLRADCSKAARELGWQARRGWREGVAEYAHWFAKEAAAARGAP